MKTLWTKNMTQAVYSPTKGGVHVNQRTSNHFQTHFNSLGGSSVLSPSHNRVTVRIFRCTDYRMTAITSAVLKHLVSRGCVLLHDYLRIFNQRASYAFWHQIPMAFQPRFTVAVDVALSGVTGLVFCGWGIQQRHRLPCPRWGGFPVELGLEPRGVDSWSSEPQGPWR